MAEYVLTATKNNARAGSFYDRIEGLYDLTFKVNGYGRSLDQYFEAHPHLTGELAKSLVEAGVTLVGIDSFNIDSTDDGTRPVHTALLAAGIPIVEHMCGLRAIPNRGPRFFAVPVKVKGMGTFPVRAFARVPE